MNFEVDTKCHVSFFNTLGLFDYFYPGGSPTFVLALGGGPITPPGPAMVLTDRKDLN